LGQIIGNYLPARKCWAFEIEKENLMLQLFKKIFAGASIPEKYNAIFTHLTPEEKQTLLSLSKGLANGSVLVEIGSYLGASSCLISLGAKNKNNTLYCVDTWQNDAMTEGKRETFDIFKENTSDFGDIICPLRGKSDEVAAAFDKQIDFIFFDGDHSYEGIKTDWEKWSPKLKRGAVTVFHDWGWAEGVMKVINEDVKPHVAKEGSLPNMYWAWIKEAEAG
jgi:predicted O-methyltransferase YrrM